MRLRTVEAKSRFYELTIPFGILNFKPIFVWYTRLQFWIVYVCMHV